MIKTGWFYSLDNCQSKCNLLRLKEGKQLHLPWQTESCIYLGKITNQKKRTTIKSNHIESIEDSPGKGAYHERSKNPFDKRESNSDRTHVG
jgi:hypothetical protein